VPICDRATLDKAVEAAAAAFPAWRDKSWAERAEAVKKWGEHYQSSIPDLIPLLTAEQGKALGISHYEANAVTEW
jgi:acyl-CoA reductase-like NAD-dependent aldehyde dehydrogenase